MSATEQQERYWRKRLGVPDANAAGKRDDAERNKLLKENAALKDALAKARAENAALKDELVVTLGGGLAPPPRKPAPPKTAKPPLPPDEARERIIKGLRTQVQNLKEELRFSEQHYKDALAKAGGLPRAGQNAIAKVLHPDTRRGATDADRDAAATAFFNWMGDSAKARRR
jgi:hypothetical protein